MIAFLRGQLLEKDVDAVVVDVHGVGYRCTVSQLTMSELPAEGGQVQLRVHTHVREDALLLYGFTTRDEEELFHHLTQVSGVGPKLAITILSGMAPRELAVAIGQGEIARLTKINGVGKKTAERLVVELKDKLKVSGIAMPTLRRTQPSGPRDELVSALVNLQYRPADAERAASIVLEQNPGATLQTLVPAALQLLTSRTG